MPGSPPVSPTPGPPRGSDLARRVREPSTHAVWAVAGFHRSRRAVMYASTCSCGRSRGLAAAPALALTVLLGASLPVSAAVSLSDGRYATTSISCSQTYGQMIVSGTIKPASRYSSQSVAIRTFIQPTNGAAGFGMRGTPSGRRPTFATRSTSGTRTTPSMSSTAGTTDRHGRTRESGSSPTASSHWHAEDAHLLRRLTVERQDEGPPCGPFWRGAGNGVTGGTMAPELVPRGVA